MQVIKGKQQTPIKGVAYGHEGVGKSSLFASSDAVYIDVEGGTNQLDVNRVRTTSFSHTQQFLNEFKGEFKIIVIDTADWLEKQISEKVCMASNKSSIEEFGYGKGWVYVAEEWKRLLDRITAIQSQYGTHVVFLAHATLRKFEQPDEMGSYDRWELKLSKTTSPILKEWSDMLLFLNYKTIVVADESGKKFKAQGGKRVIYTSHHPAWDAKNRFGLAEELPLEWKSIEHVFTDTSKKQPESRVIEPTAPPPPVKHEPTEESIPMEFKVEQPKTETEQTPERKDLLAKLKQLMVDGNVTKEDLVGELARKGVVPVGTHPKDFNIATIKRVIAGFSAISHNIKTLNNKNEKAA